MKLEHLGRVRVSEAALPYVMAALAGSAAAVMAMLAPAAGLEALVEESGLPAVLAAAQPPLGMTARGLLAGAAALLVAAVAFTALRALEGLPPIRAPKFTRSSHVEDAAPEIIAPVIRKPIFAEAELGAPFNSVVAAETRRSEPPAPRFAREETPVIAVAPEPEPVAPPMSTLPEPQSIAEMIARLEAGMQRRRANAGAGPVTREVPPPDMDAALRDALGTLQRMTARSRA